MYVTGIVLTLLRTTLSGITSGSCEAATFDFGAAFEAGFFSLSLLSFEAGALSFLGDVGLTSDMSEEDGDAGGEALAGDCRKEKQRT